MRLLQFLTGILPQLQKRQTYNNGQYTQVVQATSISWSEEYYTSYRSTEIITITSSIPCPILTTYTTVYECESCGPCTDCGEIGPTVCEPKSCSAGPNSIESTEYGVGEFASASITSQGVVLTTYIAAAQCSSFAPFEANGSPQGLETCPGAGPVPQNTAICLYSPCILSTTVIQGKDLSTSTITGGTPYIGGQEAPLAQDPAQATPASLCVTFVTPENNNFQGVPAATSCGAVPVTSGGGNQGTCGVSVVTYKYTTAGATVIMATTIPLHCGPFSLNGGGNRRETASANLMFWIWTISAALSGIGMIVL